MLTVILALVLGLLVVLGIAVSISFRSLYLNETEDRLLRVLDDVNDIVVDRYLDVDKRTSAREEFQVMVRLHDAYLQLCFDEDELGRYSAFGGDTGSRWAVAEEADLSEYISEVKSGYYESCRYNLLTKYTGFATLTAMRPITDAEGNDIGVIFFHYDMTGVDGSIATALKNVAVLSAVAIIVSIPLVTLLVRSVTQPISRMTEVVRDFAKGNFARRAQVKGHDELANLGLSFNTMADELNTLEEARRSFVANVSHELRSPLTSMRGFLEAMLDGTIPYEDRDGYLEIVLDENIRMTAMVNDLLDLARIESGQYKLNLSVFDINELIRRILITFMARIDAKHLICNVDIFDEPIYVEADRTRITQVIHNLIDNAVKYSNAGGSLLLECRPERHYVKVTVTNTGAGIPEEDLPHIFDRFYKAEKAHTPSGGSGTGLGLSIAKLIMDLHGQNLTVTSRKGVTRFSFTLKKANMQRRY